MCGAYLAFSNGEMERTYLRFFEAFKVCLPNYFPFAVMPQLSSCTVNAVHSMSCIFVEVSACVSRHVVTLLHIQLFSED